MATLAAILSQEPTRPRVIRACVDLVEAEVAQKRGLSGAAIRTGFRVVKAVKPSMVADVVRNLLPDFAKALEPLYVESREQAEAGGRPMSETFTTHLSRERARAAAALLEVTDQRAEKVSGPVKKAYKRLRGTAQQHVEAAVPNLARTLAPFL